MTDQLDCDIRQSLDRISSCFSKFNKWSWYT